MGRPLIGPAHGGAAEMIEDGKSGVLTRPGDASALAAAIIRLHRDPDYARRLGGAARDRALHLFAVEEHVRRVQAAYDRLLATGVTS
jgi:glycosyltransferase involved in cell wall biosynthesis